MRKTVMILLVFLLIGVGAFGGKTTRYPWGTVWNSGTWEDPLLRLHGGYDYHWYTTVTCENVIKSYVKFEGTEYDPWTGKLYAVYAKKQDVKIVTTHWLCTSWRYPGAPTYYSCDYKRIRIVTKTLGTWRKQIN